MFKVYLNLKKLSKFEKPQGKEKKFPLDHINLHVQKALEGFFLFKFFLRPNFV
jgi:hypothetical protein